MDVREEQQVVVAPKLKSQPNTLVEDAGYDLEKGTIGGTGGESASRVPSTSISEAVGEEKQQQRQEQGTPADIDTNVVWWESDDDRENPLNWTARKKWMNLALPSFITFITYDFLTLLLKPSLLSAHG